MYLLMDMKSRKYDMGARQQAKTATRDAIITAAIDTFMAERHSRSHCPPSPNART